MNVILISVLVKVCLLLKSERQSLHVDKKNISHELSGAQQNVLVHCFGLHAEGEDIGQQLPKRRTLCGILVRVGDGTRSSRRKMLRVPVSEALDLSPLLRPVGGLRPTPSSSKYMIPVVASSKEP